MVKGLGGCRAGRFALGAATAGVVWCGATAASAHPHVWIKARSEIVFDAGAKLTGIRESWTFDEAYSAFMTINLDSNHDGVPDPDKLADLARTNLASVAEYGYFTTAKANGKPAVFGAPENARQTFSNGRLHLDFILPLAASMPPPKVMVLTIDDPSFFVAFSFESDVDAIRLTGPKTGCALAINRPAQTAQEGKQIVPDDIAASAAPAVGVEYVSRVILACP